MGGGRKASIRFSILFLALCLIILSYPLSFSEALKYPRVYVKHGERTFTFANGTFIYGVLRYSIDVIFEIYKNYSIVVTNETIAFFPLYSEYSESSLKIFEKWINAERFGYSCLFSSNEAIKHPIASIKLIDRHTLHTPIVHSISSPIKTYFLLAPCENETIEPNCLYAKWRALKLNYTDPAVTYFSHCRGFEISFVDGTTWIYLLPEDYKYALVDVRNLNVSSPQRIPMKPDIILNNLPLKKPARAEWYTRLYREYTETLDKLNEMHIRFNNLESQYYNLLWEREAMKQKIFQYKACILGLGITLIIVIALLLRSKRS